MFLKGEKCELHALEESDYEAMAWTQAVNAGLTTQHLLTGAFPVRVVDIKGVWKRERESGDVVFGIWALKYDPPLIKDQPELEFIGTCGLYGHRDIYKSWEARFLIFRSDGVGHGYGEDATRLLTGYAFNRLNAHRVWLGVSADNLRAVKCYLNAGYKMEGTLRDELFYDGKYHDVYRMSALESEWRSSLQAAAR